MDLAAEFTLQIARLAQDRFAPPRSAVRWTLIPGGRPLTWREAREALASLPKPVMIAPLAEPGSLGVWLPGSLDEADRGWFQQQVANQGRYWERKLAVCGLADTDPIVFEPATPALSLTAREFMQWAGDYMLGVHVTMHRNDDGMGARFLVMPPGGGGPPLGLSDPYEESPEP